MKNIVIPNERTAGIGEIAVARKAIPDVQDVINIDDEALVYAQVNRNRYKLSAGDSDGFLFASVEQLSSPALLVATTLLARAQGLHLRANAQSGRHGLRKSPGRECSPFAAFSGSDGCGPKCDSNAMRMMREKKSDNTTVNVMKMPKLRKNCIDVDHNETAAKNVVAAPLTTDTAMTIRQSRTLVLRVSALEWL